MIHRICLLCIVVATTGSAAIAQPEAAKPKPAYEIRLFRPLKQGDRYRLKATDTRKQFLMLSRDGKVQQTKSKTTRFQLEAEVTILKVDNLGHPLKKALAIERFTDGKRNELLKKGDIVFAESIEGKTVYRLQTGPLPAAVISRLRGVVKTRSTDNAEDDEAIFGSKQPRAIGATWNVNPAGVAKALNVDAQAVSGRVTLKERTRVEGLDCLRVVAEIKVTSFPGAKRLEAGGYQLQKPSIAATLSQDVPVDLQNPSTRRTASVTMQATMIGTTPARKGVTLRTSAEWSTEATRIFHK